MNRSTYFLHLILLLPFFAHAWEGPKLTVDPKSAPSVRTWADVRDSIASSMAKTGEGYFAYSRTFNDIGPIDTSGTLTSEELRTQFAMACVLASPITVKGPAPAEVKTWLADKMLMNVNNDKVARQGHVVAARDGTFVVLKYLWGMNDANAAVAFYNPTDAARRVTATCGELCYEGEVTWTDRFDASQTGTFREALAFDVPAHGVILVHLNGKSTMRRSYSRVCAMTGANGSIVWRDVFVPRDGKYNLRVITKGTAPCRVRVNGLVVGECKGTERLEVTLWNPENAIVIEGAGADAVEGIEIAGGN